MCKTNVINWMDLKATSAIKYLKRFPACGVRYAHIDGHSLVLVHPDVKDQELIKQKRLAASRNKPTKTVSLCVIPPMIAKAARI